MSQVVQTESRLNSAVRERRFQELKAELHDKLVSSMDHAVLRTVDPKVLRDELRRGAEQLCGLHADLLSQADRNRLIEELVDETLGLGPLEPLMHDPTISDILINGPRCIYVERRGRLEKTPIEFRDIDHLLGIVQRLASQVGRRIDESSPMVDARLLDGSRLNAVIKPLALDGALVSIRRFSARPFMPGDLVARKGATAQMLDFLAACVHARLNILISGGTGSGKTTLLNMLSGFISGEERIATIEDAAELQLQQPHVARMETRHANLEGKGEVTSRELLRNALRMRPDRIIVGECRGAEAFDMLQAMNTGHDGSMSTLHANDTRDALSRLEMLVGMAAPELPMWFIHRQIASAIHIVVQMARLTGGERKITQISEVTGLHGETINMHDLFVFRQTGVDAQNCVQGQFEANGIVPNCMARLQAAGVHLPRTIFEQGECQIDRFDVLRGVR
jgi:pilus assembly protein CpaF